MPVEVFETGKKKRNQVIKMESMFKMESTDQNGIKWSRWNQPIKMESSDQDLRQGLKWNQVIKTDSKQQRPITHIL